MILGMLVTRDEGYFLVIVISYSYILDKREITSPSITTSTIDDNGYYSINPMDSTVIILCVPANHSLESGSRLTCYVYTS